MKKVAKLFAWALVFLVVAFPASAQDAASIAGKWELTNETPRGTMTSTFTFEQDGNVLTGTVEGGRGGAMPISDGSVEGNAVAFKVVRGRAGSGQTMEFEYTGTVDGDTITGTMTTPRGDREFTMTRVEG